MELKCVKVYMREVQSHFSPRVAIRYRYYRCLRSTARFNLTPLDEDGPVTCRVLFTSNAAFPSVGRRALTAFPDRRNVIICDV